LENKNLKEIFERYLAGKASPEEVKQLLTRFDKEADEAGLRAVIRQQLESGHDVPEELRMAWEPVLQETYHAIKAQIDREHEKGIHVHSFPAKGSSRIWLRYVAAASVMLLIVSAALVYLSHRTPRPIRPVAGTDIHDIAPGSINKATLILSNGKTIALDTLKTGMVSTQGNTKIVKQGAGMLAYNKSSKGKSTIFFNKIITPRGGQYQVELSDGTKVWLNDASSIYFPNEFTGKEREVHVTGEAYFEVTKNVDRPFKVQVNDGITIRVLGTNFNVMAYQDEAVAKITLLEGAVKIAGENKEILLKPGQQAQLSKKGDFIRLEDADLQGTIAWTNNQFWFNDDSIQTVMRQLARWYDVDVVINGNITQHFDGYISRNIYVSKVFEALQATSHLQYKIKNDTIIVSP
jgi:hypothetical protein